MTTIEVAALFEERAKREQYLWRGASLTVAHVCRHNHRARARRLLLSYFRQCRLMSSGATYKVGANMLRRRNRKGRRWQMTPKQLASIERHGRDLLRLFPAAAEKDPVKLCKKLRRMESRAHRFALRCCNGPAFRDGRDDEIKSDILYMLDDLLGWRAAGVRCFLNRDARGYALKFRDPPVGFAARDWGGYGIIAPDIGKDGGL